MTSNPPRRGGGAGDLAASLLLDLLYLLSTPLLLLGLLIVSRGLTRPKLRRGLLAKLGLGLPSRAGDAPLLWVHAVSVGEVQTAVPLVAAWRSRHPNWEIRLSVATFTGREVALAKLAPEEVIYAPLDYSFCVRRFLRRLRPAMILLVELELWPNLLLCARRAGIPTLVANGRISERSAARYALGGGLTRALFRLPASIAAQNNVYRDRFLGLGVPSSGLEVLGNLKHDRQPSPSVSRAAEVRAALGWPAREVVVVCGGSTHPGEELALAAACRELSARGHSVRLVLVPRHVERLAGEDVGNWKVHDPLLRWSKLRGQVEAGAACGTLVVDTVGELELFYALADVVLVGGTLIPHGGQNLLEPARLGKAILFGPHYRNFQEEGDLLLGAGAARLVPGTEVLREHLGELVARREERDELGRAAAEVCRRLGGSLERHLDWIHRVLQLYLPPTA